MSRLVVRGAVMVLYRTRALPPAVLVPASAARHWLEALGYTVTLQPA